MKKQAREQLIQILKQRFEKNGQRHRGIAWDEVHVRLNGSSRALASLQHMEQTGGEPDVIGRDPVRGQITFCDCSVETPSGRRSLCYDREAMDSRKEHKPSGSAVETADSMGIQLLPEEQYRTLQSLGEFDLKTSIWILTPPDVRSLGGVLFCDRRYGRVFVYHNGAQSYYDVRGFRGLLHV